MRRGSGVGRTPFFASNGTAAAEADGIRTATAAAARNSFRGASAPAGIRIHIKVF